MDLSFLQDLGTKLIEQPKFEKIIGKTAGKEFAKVLKDLVSDLKEQQEIVEESISGIGIEPNQDENLNVEQQSLKNSELKNKAKSKVKVKIQEIKRKIELLKQQNIPRFETYTVNGRIYDSQTATPLKGVKVSLGIDAASLGVPPLEGDVGVNLPKEISALNVDIKLATDFRVYTPLPILTAKLPPTTTDKDGYYSITFKALVLGIEDDNNNGEKRELTSILGLGLNFQKPKYLPTSTSLITLNNKIKKDISTKGLFNIDQAAELAKDEFNNTIYAAGQRISSFGLEIAEKVLIGRKKSVQKVTNLLTQKLIPLLIGILLTFAISKPSQMEQAVCPSPQNLKDAIARRNRAIRQINQIFTSVIINTGLAAVFLVLTNSLFATRMNLDALPFPMSFGTPPAKDFGGLAGSITYNVIAALQRIDDLLEELEDINKTLNKQVIISLAFLIAGLIIAKLLIKAIDKSISKCAQDKIDSGEITLEELREELNDLEAENEEQGLATIGKVNGFDIVVIEGKNVVGSITPRQAIAKNSDGVIQLRGEQSFSATDQVLINELAFYIKSNNLKAF